MYVVSFDKLPNTYIPEDHLKEQSTWLINDEGRTRIPITCNAMNFHAMSILSQNMNIDKSWNQMRILNVFGYTLLQGVCDAPDTPSVVVEDPVVEDAPDTPIVVVEDAPDTPSVVVEDPVVEDAPDTPSVVVEDPVVEDASVVESASNIIVESEISNNGVKERTLSIERNLLKNVGSRDNGIKDIYSNDPIQDKFVKIYDSIDTIKSNGVLIMDIIQDFNMMKSKGINVSAALPDLESQHTDLIAFEKDTIEEIHKINMLNKMIHEQINALEKKCIGKAKEIEDTQ
jgi:hypothetical protein